MMEQALRDLLLQALNDRTHTMEAMDARMRRLQREWEDLASQRLDAQAEAQTFRDALRSEA